MLQEKPLPPRPEKGASPAEDVTVEVARSPLRCPFCHTDCGPDDPRVAVCQGCLSRHHAGCWRENGGRCASCSGTRALSPSPVEIKVAPKDLLLLERGLSREAVTQVAQRNRVSETEAMEALLEAASRKLAESARGLPPWAIVMIVALALIFAIPILHVLVR